MDKNILKKINQNVCFGLEAAGTTELIKHLVANSGTPSFSNKVTIWCPYEKNFEIFIDCLDNALRMGNKGSVVKYQFHQKTHVGKRVRYFNSADPRSYRDLLFGLSSEHNKELITPHKEGELDIEISISRQTNTNNFDIVFIS